MKLEFQAKYLQYLLNKNECQGFTLLNLLIIIIIFGILAVIALPSFLDKKSKSQQAEAKNNIEAINRAQQSYFLKSQDFTTSLTNLQVGIKTESENYRYSILVTGKPANNLAQVNAHPQKPALRSYIGVVARAGIKTSTTESQTIALMCESVKPSVKANTQAIPMVSNDESGKNKLECPEGFKIIPRN